MTPQEVAAHLLIRGRWYQSRASGPGGQHRDHTMSRAELIIGPDALVGLPVDIATAVAAGLRLGQRPARLSSQRDRSLERNRQTVEARLVERIAVALDPPAPRKPTRVPRGLNERRLRNKAQTSARKATRRPPNMND